MVLGCGRWRGERGEREDWWSARAHSLKTLGCTFMRGEDGDGKGELGKI
jgi:hypothetical protein